MDPVFTWLGAYQTAVTLFALFLAVRVWRARPDRFENRALALVLAMFGLMGFGSQGLIELTADPALARASQTLLYSLGAGIPFVYLAFIGTLPTPLATPFRSPVARRTLLLLAGAACLAGAIGTGHLVTVGPGGRPWMTSPTRAGLLLWYAVAAVVLHGFLAAISMLKRAPPRSPARHQAVIYAAAFGIRDAWYIAALLAAPYMLDAPWTRQVLLYQFPSLTLVFTALLAYGILRYQLFDIDLRIKWAIRRTTVASVFLACFFVVTIAAENLLTANYGWVAGSLATGLLLFALRPVQAFAERLADRTMPHVRDDAEYRLAKKLEVFRAAYEGALQDGVITNRERDILAALQDQLGITATEVLGIERAVRAGAVEIGGREPVEA